MINALHLWWIIPSCIFIGFISAGWRLTVNRTCRKSPIYDKRALTYLMTDDTDYKVQTLRDWFEEEFDSDFNKFKDTTGGVIYGINTHHQIYMIFVDYIDELTKYYNWEIQEVSIDGSSKRPLIKELV